MVLRKCIKKFSIRRDDYMWLSYCVCSVPTMISMYFCPGCSFFIPDAAVLCQTLTSFLFSLQPFYMLSIDHRLSMLLFFLILINWSNLHRCQSSYLTVRCRSCATSCCYPIKLLNRSKVSNIADVINENGSLCPIN